MSEEAKREAFPVSEAAAALLLRLSLGVLFFFAGLGKFLSEGGATGVSKSIAESFQDTILPGFAVAPFAYTLPYIELALGAALIVGIVTRQLLAFCGLLLIALALGKAVQQDHATVAQNLNYVILAALGLWFASKDNRYSVDYCLTRK